MYSLEVLSAGVCTNFGYRICLVVSEKSLKHLPPYTHVLQTIF